VRMAEEYGTALVNGGWEGDDIGELSALFIKMAKRAAELKERA
jgi:hypothetical protein